MGIEGQQKESWLDRDVFEVLGEVVRGFMKARKKYEDHLDPPDGAPDDPKTMGLVQSGRQLADKYMEMEVDPKTGVRRYKHSAEG